MTAKIQVRLFGATGEHTTEISSAWRVHNSSRQSTSRNRAFHF